MKLSALLLRGTFLPAVGILDWLFFSLFFIIFLA